MAKKEVRERLLSLLQREEQWMLGEPYIEQMRPKEED